MAATETFSRCVSSEGRGGVGVGVGEGEGDNGVEVDDAPAKVTRRYQQSLLWPWLRMKMPVNAQLSASIRMERLTFLASALLSVSLAPGRGGISNINGRESARRAVACPSTMQRRRARISNRCGRYKRWEMRFGGPACDEVAFHTDDSHQIDLQSSVIRHDATGRPCRR